MAKIHYFVTALPRSRTAWLANLFTHGDSFCHHQLVTKCDSVDDYIGKLKADTHPIVGDCGNLVLACSNRLMEEFPDAHWMFVYRNSMDCVTSYNRLFTGRVATEGEFADRTQLMISTQSELPQPLGISLAYEELDSERMMKMAWTHLTGSVDWDSVRFKMLCDFNVTVNVPKHIASASPVIQEKFYAALAKLNCEVASGNRS